MRRFALEILKVIVLLFLIVLGVILSKGGSIEVKARKIQERKGNLSKELTREERDEYMEYLRLQSGFYYENPIYKKEID